MTPASDLNILITPETGDNAAAAERLLDAVFGPARLGRTVYRFRHNIPALRTLCFTARIAGSGRAMDGLLRFWPARLPDGRVAALFGPLAVRPELQGRGVGRALIRHGLNAAAQQGFGGVLIVGAPGYYAPFGFTEAAVMGLTLPGPTAPLTFMGLDMPGCSGFLTDAPGMVTPATATQATETNR